MKIVIIGGGAVGLDLARNLSATDNDVVLVEQDAGVLQQAQEVLDCRFVGANGASPAALSEIGMSDCDLFAAVTNRDEVNIIACLTARKLGAKVTTARVRDEDYYLGGQTVFPEIDLAINPDHEAAHRIREILFRAGAREAYLFAGGRVLVVAATVEPDSEVVGKSLRDLNTESGGAIALVTALDRAGQTVIPHGDTVLAAGDTVYFTGTRRLVDRSLFSLYAQRESLQRVMIAGATTMGVELARDLVAARVKVKLVDPDPERCRQASEQLHHVLVLNCDPVDFAPLLDEGVGEMDGYVAVGADEEINILCCLLAKRHGVRRTVCLVNRADYVELLPQLGIDAAISPRKATAVAIARFVKRGAIVSAEQLGFSNAEILQYRVAKDHPAVGVPLAKLGFPRGAVIGAVIKRNGVETPGGRTVLKPGDEVLVFTLPAVLPEVERFFTAERERK
ncbi:MAG: Trk system potassium transporter TrkA [Candidatus Krumholzibacteria bacterium]|nr:Trk system potassium transporter TrkA [Candidatus Krumholzibacteria bacterium]